MSDALPYPPDTGRTHWDGCWRERGHHNCAVTRVAELEAENKKLDALWRSLACSHCLDNHDRVVQLEAERDALRDEDEDGAMECCSLRHEAELERLRLSDALVEVTRERDRLLLDRDHDDAPFWDAAMVAAQAARVDELERALRQARDTVDLIGTVEHAGHIRKAKATLAAIDAALEGKR